MHVSHHVQEASAFLDDSFAHGDARDAAQGIDETVGGRQPYRKVQHLAGHLALGVQKFGGGSRTIRAEGHRRLGVPQPADILQFGTAFGVHLEASGQGSVQHPARVGQQNVGNLHRFQEALQLRHVRRFHPAGEYPYRFRLLTRLLREVVHEGADHGAETGRVAADIARRARMENEASGGDLALQRRLPDDLRQIVAYRFGQAGRMHRYDLRIVEREDRIESLQQVALTPEYRRALGEGRGRRHDRLLVVPGQRASVVGAASLGTVAMRQAAVDAEGGVHRPDRLAGLGRIYGQGRSRRRLRLRMLQVQFSCHKFLLLRE